MVNSYIFWPQRNKMIL